MSARLTLSDGSERVKATFNKPTYLNLSFSVCRSRSLQGHARALNGYTPLTRHFREYDKKRCACYRLAVGLCRRILIPHPRRQRLDVENGHEQYLSRGNDSRRAGHSKELERPLLHFRSTNI